MYAKLNRYYNGGDKLWSDFEKELPNLNQKALYDYVKALIKVRNIRRKELNVLIPSPPSIYEFQNEVDYLQWLPTEFTKWIEQIPLDKVHKKYNLPIPDSWFLTFNYTLTLEKVYHIPTNQICHIHGKVGKCPPELVVGHNMGDDKVDEIFSSDNMSEEACKEVADLVKGWRKDTEGIIASHENFFSQLGSVEDVYVLGHSMNDIDFPYFKRIRDGVAPDAKWHISVYDKDVNDRQRKKEAVAKLQLTRVDYYELQ